MERIVNLHPDLALASTHFKAPVADRIKALHIPFIKILSQESISGAGEIILRMGDILGVPNKADSLWKTIQQSMQETIGGIPPRQVAPTVYYAIGFGKQGEHTAGSNTFIHELMTWAGGINIAADVTGWSYNLETLLQKNPDIIIVQTGMKTTFCNQAHYRQLKAVKTNGIYEVDHHLIQLNGPRVHIALHILRDLFYSEDSNELPKKPSNNYAYTSIEKIILKQKKTSLGTAIPNSLSSYY